MVNRRVIMSLTWPALSLLLGVLALVPLASPAWPADAGIDYPGTVVMVDPGAGKLAVKKEGGGSRFTFVVNDKTQFEGGLKSLKDVKQGAPVLVKYVTEGSQYTALKVTAKGK